MSDQRSIETEGDMVIISPQACPDSKRISRVNVWVHWHRALAPKMRTEYKPGVRIIAVSTLRNFWNRPGRGDAEMPLRAWVGVVVAARWSKPTDVKSVFRSADILPNGRAIFDIGGNKYRLVAAIHYRGQRVYVRFIGTHRDYDKIDASTI